MVTDQPPPSKASRAAELAALKASSSGLFDHLMKVATDPSTPKAPPPPAARTAAGAPEASAADKAAFLQVHGSSYGYGGRIDDLYSKEVGCRLPPGHHYLDYTGSSLYATSQLGMCCCICVWCLA